MSLAMATLSKRTRGVVLGVFLSLSCVLPCRAEPVNPVGTRPSTTYAHYRSPGTARALALGFSLGSLAVGGLLFSAKGDGSKIGGIVVAGLGISFGASAGHFYTRETRHGWVSATGRLVAFTLGGLLFFQAYAAMSVEYPRISEDDARAEAAIGLALVAAGLALAVYDVVDAPRAARRANARNGIERLSLAPFVAGDGPALGRGLALQGRF
jgi:hypothetical protein